MQVDTFFNRVDDPASIFAADPDVLVLGIVPQDEAFGWEFLASNLVQLIVGLVILEPMLVGRVLEAMGRGRILVILQLDRFLLHLKMILTNINRNLYLH